MAINQSQIAAVGATRINVGLSALIRLTPSAYETGIAFKILSGGGTLEIAPTPIATSGSSAAGWAIGYPVAATETVTIANGSPVVYLCATGATMVVQALVQFTNGQTLP